MYVATQTMIKNIVHYVRNILLFEGYYSYIYIQKCQLDDTFPLCKLAASNMLMPFGKQIVAEFYKTESRLRRLCLYFA